MARKKGEKTILRFVRSLSSQVVQTRLFENDFLPKETYDKLVNLYTITVVKNCTGANALNSILSHPHCSEDTVKQLLSVPSNIVAMNYGECNQGYYWHYINSIFYNKNEFAIKYLDQVDWNSINSYITGQTVKETKNMFISNKRRYSRKRTSDYLSRLSDVVDYIKTNPALALISNSEQIRELSKNSLQKEPNEQRSR